MKKLIILPFFMAAFIADGQVKLDHKTHEQKLNEGYCTGMFKSTDGTILDVLNSNTTSYHNILDWLEGRAAGLTVYTTRTGNKIPMIRGQQPSIFVDEVPVHYTYLRSLPVADIAMVKVIRTPFMGGFGGGGGAIAVYTIRADEGDEDEEDNKD
jgi:hypothetical protein